MFIHVDHPKSMFYHVYDLLSQSEIRECVWADEESGKYCRYKRNKNAPKVCGDDYYIYDRWVVRYDEVVTEVRRGKIKIIYRGEEE